MTRLLDKAIVVGLPVAVVFTALAMGTVEAWSVAIFQLIVVVLLLLWAAKAIIEKRVEIKFPAAALPLTALVLLGLAQSVALGGGSGQTNSLSMDVEATRGAVSVIFFLLVCFVIAASFFDNRDRLRHLANFLISFGLVLAVFALVQHFTWEGRLFWVRPVPWAPGTGGPFVNRNHFAGYMEMLIPIAVALALSRSARLESRLYWGFAAAIMGIAEAASLSRGGIISLILALLFISTLTILRRRGDSGHRRKTSFILHPATFVLLMVTAIIVGIVWVGADFDILKRIADDPLSSDLAMDRKSIWADTLRMFVAHPISGIGLGAFETVYPMYGRGDGTLAVQFAHNDYLQALSDGGIVGGALAAWFLIVMSRAAIRALKVSDPLMNALGLGSAAGIFALLVHSLFDFNLQLPSNALLFLTLSAMLWGVAALAGRSERERGHRARIEEAAFATR